MKKILMALFIFLPAALSALTVPYSTAATEKGVEAICGVTEAIIADSFSPMTHYNEGDGVITLSPSYVTIDKVYDSPEIKGDGLTGKSAGIGTGKALSGRFMVYGIAAALNISGDIAYNDYSSGNLTAETDFSLFSLHGGGGYDLIDSTVFSMPVFAGVHIQYYSAELTTESVPVDDGFIYDTTLNIDGSGLLYGISGGIAPSIKLFGRLKITPYLMFLYNLNSTSLDANFTFEEQISHTKYNQSADFDVDPIFEVTTGLDIGLESKSGFSVSLALGGLITTLTGKGSSTASRGVEMTPVVLIVSYKY